MDSIIIAAKAPTAAPANAPTASVCRSVWWKLGRLMKNDFVVASLFSDYNMELPDEEKKFSPLLNSRIETVGDKYEDLQQQLIKASGQPNYVFVDGDGKLLIDGGYGYDATKGAKEFITHLEKVKQLYKARNN